MIVPFIRMVAQEAKHLLSYYTKYYNTAAPKKKESVKRLFSIQPET